MYLGLPCTAGFLIVTLEVFWLRCTMGHLLVLPCTVGFLLGEWGCWGLPGTV